MSFRDGNFHLEESQRLEFKEAAGGLPEDLWETYSAFANAEGGEIVLGVHEDRATHSFTLVGVPDARALVDQIWSTVRNAKAVGRDVLLSDSVEVVSRGGMNFVVVDVPRAERDEKPVEVYDRRARSFVAFIRRGTADQRASRDDLDRMTYDRAADADRRPLTDYSLECLCQETVQRYRVVFAGNKPSSPWNSDSLEDFLYHIGAIARGCDASLHPTKAGLLAFGYEYEITRYLPQFLLDYREETSGASRWDDRVCSQSGDWSGNVIDFYLTVTERMLRRFKLPFSAGRYGVRHTSENPVTEAVNEAVANAIAHAHYGSAASVKVILRADDLEITNTGDFLIDRQVAIAGGFSETRNPTLMRMLGLIGATDRAGSGLQMIWAVWNDVFEDEPALDEFHSPSYVRLSLPLGQEYKDGALQRGSSHDEALVALLSIHPEGITAADVQEGLGLSERVAQKALKGLFDLGRAHRKKEGRGYRYFLA